MALKYRIKKQIKVINRISLESHPCVCVCRLYHERLSQVNSKLGEVEAGRAAEYLEPLAVLLENMQVRTKVAGKLGHADTPGTPRTLQPPLVTPSFPPLLSGIYRELCLESVKNKYECEIQAACQHWEVRDTHTHTTSFNYLPSHNKVLLRSFHFLFSPLAVDSIQI